MAAKVASPAKRILTAHELAAASTFPLRVAGIDIGSNGIRFLAAEFTSAQEYTVLDSKRVPIRLGQGVFRHGKLDPKAAAGAFRALADFRRRMQELGIRHYRAIATSAIRESSDGERLLRRVRERLHLQVEIITGSEEARLVYQAVKRRVRFGSRPWLVVNVGGGSVEIFQADRHGIVWSESHTMGAVRLLEELDGASRLPEQFRKLLTEYVATLRVPALGKQPLAGVIATGGNIEELAKLAAAPVKRGGVRMLSQAALSRLLGRLARLSPAQRMHKLGLKKDRADVILPAAAVYERLCALTGKRTLWVPYIGTKEGVVFDLVEKLTSISAHQRRQEEQLLSAAVNLGRHYAFDETHSLQVARLSLALFGQLRGLHHLDHQDFLLLLAAAVLHDIGAYISYKKHHKHSFYLISQSELPGLSQSEMLLVANIARYHRKGDPSLKHEGYMQLTKPERVRVAKLASLLRMADALDREHTQVVRRLHAQVTKSYLDLSVEPAGARPGLEQWALQRKAQLFTSIFKLKVRMKG